MTLLARPNDILAAEVRTRIRNSKNIMRSVAIVTLRRLGVAQLGNFAVVCVEVRLGDRFVASTTLHHYLQLKPGRINPADRVGRMAIAAHWQWFVRLSDLLRMDARFKLLLDSMVTSSARLGHIARVHGRECVALREHAVRCVTAGARGGYRQPTLHQSFAVDALRVMLYDFMLRARVPGGSFLPLSMTLCAEGWNICWERRRIRAQFAQNIMCTVTLFARRTIGVVLRHEFPVCAYLELLADFRVTRRTIYFFRDRFAGSDMRNAYFRVTLTARDF